MGDTQYWKEIADNRQRKIWRLEREIETLERETRELRDKLGDAQHTIEYKYKPLKKARDRSYDYDVTNPGYPSDD